jgi:hypothetical protein
MKSIRGISNYQGGRKGPLRTGERFLPEPETFLSHYLRQKITLLATRTHLRPGYF